MKDEEPVNPYCIFESIKAISISTHNEPTATTNLTSRLHPNYDAGGQKALVNKLNYLSIFNAMIYIHNLEYLMLMCLVCALSNKQFAISLSNLFKVLSMLVEAFRVCGN